MNINDLLIQLKFLRELYHAAHLHVRGADAAQDHQLFGRLYSELGAEYDETYELALGAGTDLDPIQISKATSELLTRHGNFLSSGEASNLFRTLKKHEVELVPILRALAEDARMHAGLVTHAQDLNKTHLRRFYFLRARLP